MFTTPEAAALTAHLEPLLPNYLDDLRRLCAIDSPTSSKAGVDEVGAWVRRWIARRGWEVRVWPDENAGDSLIATLRGGGQRRLLLAAHMDTVYPVGIAGERPLRTEGDRLIGPGTVDNKGGLLLGLYAMAALQSLGWMDNFGSISIVCGGDEETDMRSSAALLQELAPAYNTAFVLEPARPGGEIVGARKGIANFVIETQGKAAHAGVEPHRGAHAILALAHHVIALQELNGSRDGLTINAGTIQGGTRPNVVPDAARTEIDVRVVQREDMEPVSAALAVIAARTVVPGVTATLSGGWHFGPMARTSDIAALVELTDACAGELGFSVHDVATGGGSYANPLSNLGLPLLDGLGPIGGSLHSPQEYVAISSIVPRTALLALLMLRWAQRA